MDSSQASQALGRPPSPGFWWLAFGYSREARDTILDPDEKSRVS